MPYYITDKATDCTGWAVVKADGEVVSCQKTKTAAIKNAVAISLSEKVEFMGELNKRAVGDKIIICDIDGTMLNGSNRNDKVWDYVESLEGLLFMVTGRPESDRANTEQDLRDADVRYSRLIMNPGSTSDSVAYKRETAKKLLENYDVVVAIENNPDALSAYRSLGISAKSPASLPAVKDNPDDNNRDLTKLDSGVFMTENKWLTAAHVIKAKLEGGTPEARALGKREVRTVHSELRALEDGMTFEGYAAVFNSPSEPLPFTEIIAPGAFTRSLKSRNRMMLLWNHNTDEPLASTRNGSLQLSEDERGLKVVAKLPDTTRGRDIAELVRTGVIDSMSFGFSVRKDSWSNDGSTRTLHDVTLFETSIVSAPAYEGTAGTTFIRSLDQRAINADLLAESLEKLESGDDLSDEQANAIREVVNKLSKVEETETVEESVTDSVGDLLALAKAKVFLIEKGV